MKSKIKFEVHLSTNEVHFLDVTVSLNHAKLRTTLFTKPADPHFYLNTLSCHSKKYIQRTVYSIATYMFTKIGLPVEQ